MVQSGALFPIEKPLFATLCLHVVREGRLGERPRKVVGRPEILDHVDGGASYEIVRLKS